MKSPLKRTERLLWGSFGTAPVFVTGDRGIFVINLKFHLAKLVGVVYTENTDEFSNKV